MGRLTGQLATRLGSLPARSRRCLNDSARVSILGLAMWSRWRGSVFNSRSRIVHAWLFFVSVLGPGSRVLSFVWAGAAGYRWRSGSDRGSDRCRWWLYFVLERIWSIEPLLSRNEELVAHWERGFGSSWKKPLGAVGDGVRLGRICIVSRCVSDGDVKRLAMRAAAVTGCRTVAGRTAIPSLVPQGAADGFVGSRVCYWTAIWQRLLVFSLVVFRMSVSHPVMSRNENRLSSRLLTRRLRGKPVGDALNRRER